MKDDNKNFDIKMKRQFKKELEDIPKDIDLVFENTIKDIKNMEGQNMKNKTSMKKKSILAASIICIVALSMQTSFAKEIVNKIINSLSLSNITIFNSEDYKIEERSLEGLEVFDEYGKKVNKMNGDNKDNLYNKDGEKVYGIQEDGTLITAEVQKRNLEENQKQHPVDDIIIDDINNIYGYTCFDIKLPSYLPVDYEFDYAEFYKDDDNEIFDKGCSIYYTNKENSDSIYISQTYIYDESYSETSFKNPKNINVGGIDVIIGEEGIVWENEGVRYLMFTSLGFDQNIKIMKSIK